MAAPELTDKLVAAIESDRFDLIVVNFANTDMVGHTGDLAAAIAAVGAVDRCLGRIGAASPGRLRSSAHASLRGLDPPTHRESHPTAKAP